MSKIASYVLIFLVGVTITLLLTKVQRLPQGPEASREIAIGQPCDYKGDEQMDTKGLQCYFYGPVPATGSRKGIWIEPDVQHNLGYFWHFYYGDFVWQRYTLPGGRVSFEYPINQGKEGNLEGSNIQVVESGDGNYSIGDRDFVIATIEVVDKASNTYSMQDRVASEMSSLDSLVYKTETPIYGSRFEQFSKMGLLDGAALLHVPKTNLAWENHQFFFEMKDYYLVLNFNRSGDGWQDVAQQHILNTLMLKN